jgi:hypothetical protein
MATSALSAAEVAAVVAASAFGDKVEPITVTVASARPAAVKPRQVIDTYPSLVSGGTGAVERD